MVVCTEGFLVIGIRNLSHLVHIAVNGVVTVMRISLTRIRFDFILQSID